MIDKNLKKDIQCGSPDNNKWYEEHVLSEEQLNLLIKNKFERHEHYLNSKKLPKSNV